jgi:aryl-alcohol dehydrogenase-like predicted oxidoreductase
MQTRTLGATKLKITTIGLGTFAMGGGNWKFSWGPQDDQDSIKAIHRGLDLGVNWIDTAPIYGLGHAEEVVGRAIKGMSERPIIATKCGLCWDEKRETVRRLTAKSVREEAEASLRRLGVDVIDLYQIHWPTSSDSEIEEGWGTIADLIKKGKVRYGGVSNFSVAQLKRIQAIHPVASLQPPYSMVARAVEEELLPHCATNKIGVVAYSPMQKGLLTGKITRERIEQFPKDDHRRNDPQFQEPLLSATLNLVEGLRRVAEKRGKTLAQLAIAWVLRRAEVTSAIIGARKPSQIEETFGAADWILSEEEVTAIDQLLKERGTVKNR